jgi:hypothetical protein
MRAEYPVEEVTEDEDQKFQSKPAHLTDWILVH